MNAQETPYYHITSGLFSLDASRHTRYVTCPTRTARAVMSMMRRRRTMKICVVSCAVHVCSCCGMACQSYFGLSLTIGVDLSSCSRRFVCRPRWCPHNRNAADAMTKFKGAHSEPLFTLLRTGMYTLKGEKAELADRATQRQVGTEPRHKVSAVKSVTERVFFLVHMPST